MISTTFASKKEAKELSVELLKARLAACIQIGEVESLYEWEGRIEEQKEYVLHIKAKKDHYKHIETLILKNHSYTTPEIIFVEIKDGLDSYLSWIDSVVR